ncbi:MAG TPA: methyltransferase domain-containing protein [Candidatus Binataceae bacterium]|nr:methyltransferase domain-containing protein [Candidatus Binataceae bacterium]
MAEVEITAMTFGPFGVGRLDGDTVMVPNAAPGDLLEVTVVGRRAGHLIARAERVLRAGPARRTPPCPYLPRCGGCDWQQIDYPAQARLKGEVIAGLLRRALGLELDPATLVEPAPAEFGYRARVRFKVGPRGELGFHQAGSRHLVEVEHCMVAAEDIRMPREFVREIRCEEIEVVADRGREVLVAHLARAPAAAEVARARAIVARDPRLAGVVMRGGATRALVGETAVQVALEPGLVLEADADLFSQVNRAQNLRLVAMVMEMGAPAAGARVLDLFCGAGNFSLPAARRGAAVTGVDAEPAAVAAAARNAQRLGFGRAEFTALRAAELARFLLRARYRPDTVILDPPRTGARELIEPLVAMRAPRLIYVSCDAATLARDLRALCAGGYRIAAVRALDFFPNTHHVELVAHAVLTSVAPRS